MNKEIFLAWLHYLWFSQKVLHSIFKNSENYEEVYYNFTREFLLWNKIQPTTIDKILLKRQTLNLKEIEDFLEDKEVSIITIHDENYPENLTEIKNIPFIIYVKWNIWNEPKIWIVWSRKISNYWKKFIENIVPNLVNNFTIVSGWALWCDTYAHKEAILSWWKTIVCVWTWIDKIYPASSKNFYDEIVEKWGAILSIFPIWTTWNNFTFPIRNEIIVWLSKWIVVIEAQNRSWSLITARLALENNRNLFAVPWDVFNLQSSWTNDLIKSWKAKMILDYNDILEQYSIQTTSKIENIEPKFDDDLDKEIYQTIALEPLISDEISKKTRLSISDVSLRLSMLELSWIISKNFSWKYEIK